MSNMDNLEKVERIREKTGVSYEDAKIALEASGNDMLDAIVYLEKLGKVNGPKQSQYVTKQRIITHQSLCRLRKITKSHVRSQPLAKR